MAYFRIENAAAPATFFQMFTGLLTRLAARPGKAGDKSGARLTNASALEAFSRLSDEQLGDIGVYRKIRAVKCDTLARSFPPGKTVIFDYFRLDG